MSRLVKCKQVDEGDSERSISSPGQELCPPPPPSPEGSTYIQLLHIDVGQRPHPVSNKNHGRKLLSAVECGRRLKPVPRIRAE